MNETERAIEYIENHIPMDIGECMIKALEIQLKLQELGFTDDIINNYKQFEDECISKGFTFKNLIEARENQLNNGWIPCSERLPTMEECQKNDCRFIVTDGNRRYQDWFDYEDGYFDRCECNGRGLKKDKRVIAWQPLPEKYAE